MDLKRLRDPFPADCIEWRIGQCGTSGGKIWGTCLAYIQARAIMDRLDEVCGPENWEVNYDIREKGTLATIRVRMRTQADGKSPDWHNWIEKQDGAEETQIEPFKGGISGALKRAGAVWGIGRYLYRLDVGFITIVEKGTKGAYYGKTKEGQTFYWLPPALPEWALPAVEKKSPSVNTASTAATLPSPISKSPTAMSAPASSATSASPSGVATPDPGIHCMVCGAAMKLSSAKTRYYCPNFKDTTQGEHSNILVSEVAEFKKRQDDYESDVPF